MHREMERERGRDRVCVSTNARVVYTCTCVAMGGISIITLGILPPSQVREGHAEIERRNSQFVSAEQVAAHRQEIGIAVPTRDSRDQVEAIS